MVRTYALQLFVMINLGIFTLLFISANRPVTPQINAFNKDWNSMYETIIFWKTENPHDPLQNMEICRTKRCSNEFNSGRFGCARNCKSCEDHQTCSKWHGGTDLRASLNTDFYCMYSGNKVAEGFSKTWGFYLMIGAVNVKDRNGLIYSQLTMVYCHLNPSAPFPNFLHQGDRIGLTGNTGNALDEEPHLHIEFFDGNYDKNKGVDPQLFFATDLGANENITTCRPANAIQADCCGQLPNLKLSH